MRTTVVQLNLDKVTLRNFKWRFWHESAFGKDALTTVDRR